MGSAILSTVSFATRGPSPQRFQLHTCLVHPRDEDKAWWVRSFAKAPTECY